MLENWDYWMKTNSNKVKNRIWKGVPLQLRGIFWKKLLHCKEAQSKSANNFQNLQHGTSDSIICIDTDVPRTFPAHPLFVERFSEGQGSLFRILKAYSIHDPDVGYHSGMSYLAAFMRMLEPNEEDAFWMFVQIMQDPRIQLRSCFGHDLHSLMNTIKIYHSLLQKYLPKLYSHLKRENVDPAMYATKWFMLMFLDTLPWQLVLRIWDVILLEGYDFMFSVAISIMKILEDSLLLIPFEMMIHPLGHLQFLQDVNPDQFMKYIMKHKFDSKTLIIIKEEEKRK